jgi:hypothetical protein
MGRKSKQTYDQLRQEIRVVGKLRGLKGKALERATNNLSPAEVKILVNRAQRLKGRL